MFGEAPLCGQYDLVMLDLDGVVYVGGHAVPGAADHLDAVRRAGAHVAFITNNASRTPAMVAEHLRELGIAAEPEDVVTSAQAAARLAAEEWGRGAQVVMLGAAGLEHALEAEGLVPVGVEQAAGAAGMVTGYGPDVLWRDIMRAATLIRDGLPWIASNTDASLPTPHGVAPGHGVLVEALSRFTGVVPLVAGKPQRPLLDETIRRVGGDRPLMVGDRIDTDIHGAVNAGIDSLLVLTGVTGLDEIATLPREERPTYVAADLEGLLLPPAAPEPAGGGLRLGGWLGRVRDGALTVDGHGGATDWWRVAAALVWEHLDRHGVPADTASATPPVPTAAGSSE